MKRIFERIKSAFSKKTLVAVAATAVAVVMPMSTLMAADVRLEGSLGVANVTAGDTQYKQEVNASYDEVVKIQVYYHNQENPDSGKIAKNLRVKLAMPTNPGKNQVVNGTISADNTNTINSSVKVNLDRADAYLEYIPGSAVWKHNEGTNENVKMVEEKISDEIVYGGQGIVVENAKPCFNFDATITVLARVRVPGVKVDKTVRVKGQTEWKKENTAKPGDTLQYQIAYENAGNTTHKKVVLRDNLPPRMTYVTGSTKLMNSAGVKDVADGIVGNGIQVGNYTPGAAAYALFEVKVPQAKDLQCGVTEFRNVGIVRPEGMNEFYNTTITRVTKECEEPEEPKKPAYKCEMVKLTKLDGRKVRVDVDASARNGATVKQYRYNFGDGSDELVTTDDSREYTYASDGNYTVRVTVDFTVNGQTKSNSNENCVAEVSFKTPENPKEPEEPTVPTELPSTGAGDVIGIFAATTVAGALAHKVVLSRRYQ